MNRRSFISKVVQGGTAIATGLPEKLLSHEASAVVVDKIPIEVESVCPVTFSLHLGCGCPLDIENGMMNLEVHHVYVGDQGFVGQTVVHKKYFLVALLIMNTESKKT